ncbi:MAG: DUF971 domain-containing protein [Phycisphaerales bacterium]|nr:DUF971 domain-containing protein [Phycisphaerales bacterium]MCB9857962.1 DUF971 domain-containing protein [Phycisphaerales bacterium]MCB9864945.1 DUF971 domain-containing protein [Phycisphaerales bacterium]
MNENELIDLALNQPLAADEFKPVDLHIDRRAGLTIEWKDGKTSRFDLGYLRKMCPCAQCRVEREKPMAAKKPAAVGTSLTVLPSNIDKATTFDDAKLVGNYAISIVWGDGHKTGIYDFRYLRLICPTHGDSTIGK